ncbi:MAG TPA: single-stranded-DNA-specific exonuclease RecJ [Anaerolineae bacterium]|nr:single-stranded-DNA-specific exonuclease RecJ [Anaerolineae bacterium]
MWIFPESVPIDPALAQEVGGDPIVAQLLARRGITTPQAAAAFLDPDRYMPASPNDLPDLAAAADRLYRAVTRGEKIAVWGDFDADGQTSTTLLVSLLRDLQAEVTFYIPQRMTESHGIKIEPLKRLLDQRINVLLTCDTGIAEHEAIAFAKSQGVTVLVTDHHDLPDELPQADALINPKRLSSTHPLRSLPGVGVAFKLAQQLWQLAGEPERADEYLDLVALGIVADVAGLTADTRYLLQRGLDHLRRTQRLGLQAVLTLAKIDAANLSAEHIGFGLGPRLNALGRLGDANLAVELLTTTNLTRARILAAQLEGLNNQRKLLMDQILIAAQEQIAKEPTLLEYNALVLHQVYWHSGVIGPVANRLAEQYQRPVVMLVGEGNVLRGSARSVAGVDITTALKLCGEFILGVGGHPGAAGLSLPAENLPVFRRALSDSVQLIRDPSAVMDGLPIDAVLPLDQVTLEFAHEIDRLAPFGEGNPAVTFAARNVTVERDRTFGRKGEHREVTIADWEEHTQKLIWWRGAEIDLPDAPLDVAFQIKTSTFRGETALSIEWVDFRETEVPIAEVAAPPLPIEVIDWRTKNLAQITLDDFPAMRGIVTWADGAVTAPFALTRRYDLPQADVLVVWAAPCGWRELVYAIERVKPTTIYLCAADAADDHVEPFLKRLTGLLKHDITQRSGRVTVPRLAAALNQRLITARKGIEWLEAAGQISVREWSEERVTVELGGQASAEVDELASELKVLLAETAAWRQYYRRLKVELIADVARRAALQKS